MNMTQDMVRTRLAILLPRLKAWFKRQSAENLQRIEERIYIIIIPLAVAYLAATVIGGLISNSLVSGILASRARMNVRTDEASTVTLERPVMANTRDLQKVIKDRNIFNSEGKFPEEKIGAQGGGSLARFDINAPCNPTTLPIELVGTIYLGDAMRSMATVKDKSYSEADVYRVGDAIYGNEMAVVAAVERQKIIINNNGIKECIDLDKGDPNAASDGFPSFGGTDFGGLPSGSAGSGSEITVEASYVEGELGPGFGKIVDAARLVPNTVDGGINGFKIFSIKGGTLFARIGLQNGDVITQVNETSMKQPEQGFALYQAFQDEKEVRIQLLRGGTTPQNITVRIK
jgi:type II secretion system protein C